MEITEYNPMTGTAFHEYLGWVRINTLDYIEGIIRKREHLDSLKTIGAVESTSKQREELQQKYRQKSDPSRQMIDATEGAPTGSGKRKPIKKFAFVGSKGLRRR